MNSNTTNKQLYFYARMAGLSYLVFCLAGFILNGALDRNFIEISATHVDTIFQNEMHFRMAAVAETILFVGVLFASVYFYRLCRGINAAMAQIALCCRIVEVICGCVAILSSTVALTLANSKTILETLDIEQLRTLIRIVMHANFPAYELNFVFMGIAGVITFYLLMKAKYLAKFWCVWGMITYASLFIYSFTKLLYPDLPKEAMFIMLPGALFEFSVAIWLLVKGVNLRDDKQPIVDAQPEKAY